MAKMRGKVGGGVLEGRGWVLGLVILRGGLAPGFNQQVGYKKKEITRHI